MAHPAAMLHPGFAPMPTAKLRFGRLQFTNAFAAVCSCIFAVCQSTSAQPTGVSGYESIPTANVTAEHLDDFGRILGDYVGGSNQSTIWINGKIYELPIPDGHESTAEMNISPSTGGVVGKTRSPRRPLVWTAKSMYLLRNLGDAECTLSSINDSGWMVGYCDFPMSAGLWIRGQQPIDLGDLGGGRSGAVDINEKNEIVGWSWPIGLNDGVPFLWRDGEMTDVFAVSQFDGRGYASAINNMSEIVGEFTGMGYSRAGFYWHEDELTILPEPGSCEAQYVARVINDSGLIVGRAGDLDCELLMGVVWDRNQGFRSFYIDDYLIGPGERWISDARDVNNAGQIAAFGELETGEESSFLVTPYQFDLSKPVPGVAGKRNTITVTNLEPNQRVTLVFGTIPGAQPIGNGCLGGLVLIRDASTHQSLELFADQSGVATFNVFVPKSTAGKTVRYQAIAPDECEISHTVEFTF